ncbi:MAG: mechanosensitive ion channel domain-containing protein [Candidatus Binatia bacterium]
MNSEQVKDLVVSVTANPWAKIVAFAPNLMGMLFILVLGYLVSRGLQKIATLIFQKLGFDSLSVRVGLAGILQRTGIYITASVILGRLVFWLFMLTFLISATETLGLSNVSRTIDSFVRYLPNVIGAAVIVIIGMTLAQFVRDLVRSGATGLGVEYARGLGNLAYGVLIVVTGSLAVGQLQIETVLFNRVVEIVLIATGAALALALGFGTRDIARHVVAGTYLRDLYRPGMNISVGEDSGAVQDVGTVITRIRAEDGHTIYIPNGHLTEVVVREKKSSH